MDDAAHNMSATFDIDLEQAVLGACLLSSNHIETASQYVDAESFYDPLHVRMFETILQLHSEGDVTPPIVWAAMKTDEGLVQVGGVSYLGYLALITPAMPNVRDFCRILRDLENRRMLVRIGNALVDSACLPPYEKKTADIIDAISAELEGTARGGRAIVKAVEASSAAYDLARKIEQQAAAIANGEKQIAVPTGIGPLDDVIHGLMPGKLWFAGGRPGMGKSILATTLCKAFASHGLRSDYHCGEMDEQEISARLICDLDYDYALENNLRPLHFKDFLNLTASDAMLERLLRATNWLHDHAPIDIVSAGGLTIEKIEMMSLRRARQEEGHRLLVVDHLQLTNVEHLRRGANRNEEQTAITRRLKALARDLGWTVLCLSQLTRYIETRDDKRPRMHDFREGGSIEQDADGVIGCVRPQRYAQEKIKQAKNEEQRITAIAECDRAKGVMELAVLKQRSGREADYFEVFIDEKSAAIRSVQPGSIPPADLFTTGYGAAV